VTVCGSATDVGFFQITLSPALISICEGVKVVTIVVPFPPPTSTLTSTF